MKQKTMVEARVVTDIQESKKVAQGRPVHSSHEHLASPRLVLPFARHYFVTFATLSSVLTAFLLLGNRKTVLVHVVTTRAFKQKPFSAVANGKEA